MSDYKLNELRQVIFRTSQVIDGSFALVNNFGQLLQIYRHPSEDQIVMVKFHGRLIYIEDFTDDESNFEHIDNDTHVWASSNWWAISAIGTDDVEAQHQKRQAEIDEALWKI